MHHRLSHTRRDLAGLGALLWLPATTGCASVTPPPAARPGLGLSVQPARVFKTADLPRERTEAWFASVMVESDRPLAATPESVEIVCLSQGRAVSVTRYGPEAVKDVAIQLPPPSAAAPAPAAFGVIGLRLALRERAALAVDEVRLTILLRDETGAPLEASGGFAVRTYKQATSLIFPFRGPGIVTQGGAANGGHRNRSGQFAIDAMGLAPDYAVQTGEAFAVNTDLAGFGRDLVAPAAGIVVKARGDRPDQPVPGESDESFHVAEHRGSGDPGNHVVIDHQNGEFSMIAHLRAGSLLLTEGQRVEQAQPLGALGNSGDSFAPHVHYQLQDGPDWMTANGLPCRFSNVEASPLVRGEFFLAR